MDRKALEDALARKLEQMPEFLEAFEIAHQNSTGNVWLIGGIVSRMLLEIIHGIPQKDFDFDFLVENVKEPLYVPHGWSVEKRSHGNPRFTCKGSEVDIFPIATQDYIKKNRLEPTLENFFKGVPFTIQAMAFDIRNRRLVGEIGLEAVKRREYRVHNMESARSMAERKGITINDRIRKKAESMGLTPIFVQKMFKQE